MIFSFILPHLTWNILYIHKYKTYVKVLALPLCHMFPTHGNDSTDLADPDKALEHAQIFELFVQKCSVHLTLGLVYHIKLLFQTVVRLWRSTKTPHSHEFTERNCWYSSQKSCRCVCVWNIICFSFHRDQNQMQVYSTFIRFLLIWQSKIPLCYAQK